MVGIKNGMVMQRNNDNLCEIKIYSDKPLKKAAFTGEKTREVILEKIQDYYLLTGIPVGGPYTVTIDDEAFTDIFVGDLWILAGQSNMEGVGHFTSSDWARVQNENIRALFMQDVWGKAKHPLHEVWCAFDKVHTEVLGAVKPPVIYWGVGPGLSFADRMYELTGVPQGLICCAHGGTTLEQWNPKKKNEGGDKSLYAATIRRFKTNGSNVKGMFWYQGCSETFDDGIQLFDNNMKELIENFRSDFQKNIPVIQVQISKVFVFSSDKMPDLWNKIRELQRTLHTKISNIDTIYAISKSLDDVIHLSSSAQNELGIEGAECMYALIHGKNDKGCIPSPKYVGNKAVINPLSGTVDIEVTFENLYGALKSEGLPYGFEISDKTDSITGNDIFDIKLSGNKVILRVGKTADLMENSYLFYGFGLTPYCNITDQKGRSIPALGPVKVNFD